MIVDIDKLEIGIIIILVMGISHVTDKNAMGDTAFVVRLNLQNSTRLH